jgi:hypothetical protein
MISFATIVAGVVWRNFSSDCVTLTTIDHINFSDGCFSFPVLHHLVVFILVLTGFSMPDSLRSPTFPFSITDEKKYLRAVIHGMTIAAETGNIEHLDLMELEFHGVEFVKVYAEIALERSHLEFFKRYTMFRSYDSYRTQHL